MVSEATVFESRVSDSDKRYLSACIVIRNVSVDDNWWKPIRAFIRSQLPEYMVPTKFHLCETLPRNLHGKVDQEQLIRRFSLSVTESMTPSTTADSLSKEVILADAFRSVLNLNKFDTSDSFFDLGGDSLGLFEITEHVRKHGIQVSPQLIARYESVDGICAAIDAGLIGEDDVRSACELRADVSDLLAQVKILEFTLSSASNVSKCLLLTGATGFLGSRLLANLLAEFNGEIVCLVRGFSDEIAQSRLEAKLIEIKKPLNDSARSRLRVIAGDLTVGQLGMKASEYHKLTKEVDHVIHCAAEVNLLSSYERLRPANVSATLELALFVLTGKAKRFDFMSTLSVFVASDKPRGMHLESDTLKESRFIHGGYAQSKWAAEILLRSIPELIASTRYFRLGLQTTDRNTQQSPTKDLLEWLVRGTVELGCYPELDESIRMDVTPVDYAADILSRLVLTQTADNTFHLAHPIGLQANTLFNIIEKMLPNVRNISLDEYKVILNSQSEEFLQSPTGLTLSRSLIPETRNINHPFNLFQATNTTFDMQHTQRYLNGVGSQPPSVSRNEIIKMLQPICAELTERVLT
ncbi:MAG: thioester reductase domain-containing protein [Planctomycetaceae bacterium]